MAVGALGLVAAAVYLSSGIGLMLMLVLSPTSGSDVILFVAKAIDLIGWLAIGAWLLIDWRRLRLRVLLAPAAAWVLVYGLIWTISNLHFGQLNVGY